jgi:hypothetical protein
MPAQAEPEGRQQWIALYTSDVARKSKRWKDGILESCPVPGSTARVRLQLYECADREAEDTSFVKAAASQSASEDPLAQQLAAQKKRRLTSELLSWAKFDCSGEVFGLGERFLVQVIEPAPAVAPTKRSSLGAPAQHSERVYPADKGFVREHSSTGHRNVVDKPAAATALTSRRGLGTCLLRKRFQQPASKLEEIEGTREIHSHGRDCTSINDLHSQPRSSLGSTPKDRPRARTRLMFLHRVTQSSTTQPVVVESASSHIEFGGDAGRFHQSQRIMESKRVRSDEQAEIVRKPNDDELLAILQADDTPAATESDSMLPMTEQPHTIRAVNDPEQLSAARSSSISSMGPYRKVRHSRAIPLTKPSAFAGPSLHAVATSITASAKQPMMHIEELPLFLPRAKAKRDHGAAASAALSHETSPQSTQLSTPIHSESAPNSWKSVAAYRQEMLLLLAGQMQRLLDNQREFWERAAQQLLNPSNDRTAFELLENPRQRHVVLLVRKGVECFTAAESIAKLPENTRRPSSAEAQPERQARHGAQKYYLRFSPESDLLQFASHLARDDLWALATYASWQAYVDSERELMPPSVTLVRSLYHGVSTTSGLLEVEPVGPRHHSLWRKQQQRVSILAMRCAQFPTEFLCLDAFRQREPFERIQVLRELVGLSSLTENGRTSSAKENPLSGCDSKIGTHPTSPAARPDTDQPMSLPHAGQVPISDRKANTLELLNSNQRLAGTLVQLAGDQWTAEQHRVVQLCLKWVEEISISSARSTSSAPHRLLALHGAFGTGKTITLVRAILAMLERQPALRILVAAGTNVAVDNILLGLLRHGYASFARAGNERRMHPRVCNFTRKGLQRIGATRQGRLVPRNSSSRDKQFHCPIRRSNIQSPDALDRARNHCEVSPTAPRCRSRPRRLDSDDQQRQHRRHSSTDAWAASALEANDTIGRQEFRRRAVVGVTCASATQSILQGLRFDVIIVDEASQVIEPLTMVPVLELGADHCLVIVAGDERQLPPLVPGQAAVGAQERHSKARSLLERLAARADIQHVYLTVQFRCHPQIASIASELAYAGVIRSALSADAYPALVPGLAPVSFMHTGGEEQTTTDGSRCNPHEAQWIIHFLESLWQHDGVEPAQVGVICMYRAQVALIEQLFRSRGVVTLANEVPSNGINSQTTPKTEAMPCKVSTVDAFQGGERKLIILSTVRTQRSDGKQLLDSLERVNVALTRASHHLVVTGHRRALTSSPVWRQVISRCLPLHPEFGRSKPE